MYDEIIIKQDGVSRSFECGIIYHFAFVVEKN